MKKVLGSLLLIGSLASCSNDKCADLCKELNAKQEEIRNFINGNAPTFDRELVHLMKIKNKLIDEARSIKKQMKESNCDCEIDGDKVEYEDYL